MDYFGETGLGVQGVEIHGINAEGLALEAGLHGVLWKLREGNWGFANFQIPVGLLCFWLIVLMMLHSAETPSAGDAVSVTRQAP